MRYAQLEISGIYPHFRQGKPVISTESANAIVTYMHLSLDVGTVVRQRKRIDVSEQHVKVVIAYEAVKQVLPMKRGNQRRPEGTCCWNLTDSTDNSTVKVNSYQTATVRSTQELWWESS